MPKFSSVDELASSDDSDEGDEHTTKIIGWTFEEMLEDNVSNNNIDAIINRITKTGKYKELKISSITNKEDFFEKTFLGFSYIIPARTDKNETQKFFSTLFRNMNYLGLKLSPLESRRSLYYLNAELEKYFDGQTSEGKDVLCEIKMYEKMQLRKIDIVRYMSILSQYVANNNDVRKVLVGYSAYSSRENYYADYVSYIVNLEQDDRTDKFNKFNFDKTFPNNNWLQLYDSLYKSLNSIKEQLGLDAKRQAFKSWVDADYWLFGLIYFILFERKTIQFEEKLIDELAKVIKEKRDDDNYSKNTNRLNNLRDRIQSSIDIYSAYAK